MLSSKTIIGLLGVLAVGISNPAFAHAKLVRSNPAANSSVSAPKTISLSFGEGVVPRFSTLDLTMMGGGHNMKMPMKTTVSRDHKTLIGMPQGAVMKGSYQVKWTVVAADDGHRMQGVVPFKVR